ncbi:MAG: hypothetical protein COA45_05465 [Zetaproteobacteria bacterium]|nr:MAG: hypothetical protein COA45_05465 [Zetaproteobacteria bacterium]
MTSDVVVDQETEKKSAESEENFFVPKVGEFVKDEGFYLGTYEPQNADGTSSGIVYDLYAEPMRVSNPVGQTILNNFNDSATQLRVEGNGYGGHSVGDYVNAKELNNQLITGDYLEEWVIPTEQMMEQLIESKDLGDFNDTFNNRSGYDTGNWGLTCSEIGGTHVTLVNMEKDHLVTSNVDKSIDQPVSIQLVRLEPVTPEVLAQRESLMQQESQAQMNLDNSGGVSEVDIAKL